MADLSVTGGARVGLMNASWPLARLTAGGDRLTVSVFLLGTYEFTARQIVSLEPRGSIPVLNRGIRLKHNRPDYPERIEFWALGNRDRLLDRIRAAGFGATGPDSTVRPGRGFPLRWRTVIILLLAWNLPFLIDHLGSGYLRVESGGISLIPVGGAFAFFLGYAAFPPAAGFSFEGRPVGQRDHSGPPPDPLCLGADLLRTRRLPDHGFALLGLFPFSVAASTSPSPRLSHRGGGLGGVNVSA